MGFFVRLATVLNKYEKLVPLALWGIFVLITVPGISWGAPGLWHPDEIIRAADTAIEKNKGFDEENFDYPSLPKYVLYGIGQLTYKLGYSKKEFIEAARLVSVILGGLIVVMTYTMTRMMGGNLYAGMLAGLFVLSSREMALNSRFAHNDLYLAFFVCLSVLFLIKYGITGRRIWLYGAFFGVGLAASSKYNGGILLLAVLIVYLITNRGLLFKDTLRFLETLFIGLILSGAGYAIGTPKSLIWMAYYFKRAAPAILRHANYDRQPGDLIGLLGQWGVLRDSLGTAVFLLFISAMVWFGLKLIMTYRGQLAEKKQMADSVAILLLCSAIFDVPISISYNYPTRFFLPLIPLFSVLAGLFVEDLFRLFEQRHYRYIRELSIATLGIILIYSFLRVTGVALLFMNDNRIAASQFLETLPKGKTIEYTFYSPNIHWENFSGAREHPLFIRKFTDQPPPKGNMSDYNQGEAGIEERKPDFFVIDSFMYNRIEQKYTCAEMPAECEFIKRLFAGETNYQLMKRFDYSLPPFLPKTEIPFVNPVIQVYNRLGTINANSSSNP